jgi:hypothetical protein
MTVSATNNINTLPQLSQEKLCKKCNNLLQLSNFRPQRRTCKSCESTYHKEYYNKNREIKIEKCHEYKNNNKEKIKECKKIYEKKMYKNVPSYKLERCFRSRLYGLISNKDNSSTEYLGCSIIELKNWLSFNFDENMTWDNHGKYWHIDHIIPCKSFDLTKDENIYKCFHWSNLAPLEKSKNIEKSSKIIQEIIDFYIERKYEFIKSNKTKHYVLEPTVPK